MYVSIFELFKIGIGPSSSHTMGPMYAANTFIDLIAQKHNSKVIKKIHIKLYGSLAYTGIGHKTHEAICLGLTGIKADNIDFKVKSNILNKVNTQQKLNILNSDINFNLNTDIEPVKKNKYNTYPNPMSFSCIFTDNSSFKEVFYSIGGGFIYTKNEANKTKIDKKYIYDFNSFDQLKDLCFRKKVNIYDIILENEYFNNDHSKINTKIIDIWHNMNEIIDNGVKSTGTIDNILNVDKRANYLNNKIMKKEKYDPLDIMDKVSIYAIATCEENASGNKIVTAPTNGAAGIIPAVIKYYTKLSDCNSDRQIVNFIATASAIGMLFKNNASISGAEMGCQGEVGVACSMAAAGLTAALGGSVNQIENAAEIAMEHNLGLTCDPIKGLVQIPCIERNSMGAIKAINASRLALNTDKPQKVSLDQVIKTMYETGKSMNSRFKETSLGGLAVNVVEC